MAGRPGDKGRAPRRLADEERRLFERLMRGVAPIEPVGETPPLPAQRPARPRPQPVPLPSPAGAGDDVAPIDRRTARKVERGQMPIDARLDLHGDYQATAHRRLRRFVVDQATAGRRCVLVITGKGAVADRPFAEPARGVLRRQVPMWLAAPDLKPYVLGLRNAARQHGGAGAYYVLLRKPK